MKDVIKKIIGFGIIAVGIVVGSAFFVYPAIQQIAGLAVAQSSTRWNNVQDAALGDNLTVGILASNPYLFDGTNFDRLRSATAGDNLVIGLMASGLYVFDGTDFDRVRGDITNGMDVDVTRLPGTLAPADALANPTVTVGTTAFVELFCKATSQWNRWLGAAAGVVSADACKLGAVVTYNLDSAGNFQPLLTAERQVDGGNGFGFNSVQGMVFNGSTYDRIREGIFVGSTRVDAGVVSNAASRITTNASTLITAGNKILTRITVELAGTTSTVSVYDDASSPCDTGLVFGLPTVTAGSDFGVGHVFTNGVCLLTAGGVAATITAFTN